MQRKFPSVLLSSLAELDDGKGRKNDRAEFSPRIIKIVNGTTRPRNRTMPEMQ
jgi:hypothetical protein